MTAKWSPPAVVQSVKFICNRPAKCNQPRAIKAFNAAWEAEFGPVDEALIAEMDDYLKE